MKHLVKTVSLVALSAGMLSALPAKADVYFRDNDRVVLRSYVTTTPGQTVTYYTPGTVLPDTVTYNELPTTVTTKLVAPPPGDVYVAIGGNAYLIDRDKRVVVDAEKLDDDDD
jgi:hypothetical protein